MSTTDDSDEQVGEETEPKRTYAEIVSPALLFRGLRTTFNGGRIGTMVRSWQCSVCQEWAGYYRAHGHEIPPELIAADAATEPVNEHGRCRLCEGEEGEGGLLAYAAKHGIDEGARDPKNYTVSMLVTCHMWEAGLLKPKGNA